MFPLAHAQEKSALAPLEDSYYMILRYGHDASVTVFQICIILPLVLIVIRARTQIIIAAILHIQSLLKRL